MKWTTYNALDNERCGGLSAGQGDYYVCIYHWGEPRQIGVLVCRESDFDARYKWNVLLKTPDGTQATTLYQAHARLIFTGEPLT